MTNCSSLILLLIFSFYPSSSSYSINNFVNFKFLKLNDKFDNQNLKYNIYPLKLSHVDTLQQSDIDSEASSIIDKLVSASNDSNQYKMHNGLLYKYVGNVTGSIYIGFSTYDSIGKVKSLNNKNYKAFIKSNENPKLYSTVFEIIRHESYDVIPLKILNNVSMRELRLQKKEYIHNYKSNYEDSHLLVNIRNPFRTEVEKSIQDKSNYKRYIATIPNYIKDRNTKFRDYLSSKVTCECGANVCRGQFSQHKKTKKHQIFIGSIDELD